MSSYFGSVRFYKNLILLAIILCIAGLSGLAIYYSCSLRSARADITTLKATVSTDYAAELGEKEDSAAVTGLKAIEQSPAPAAEFTAEAPAYQSLYPDFYAPEKLSATESVPNTIYLTFDDGPSAHTAEILEILAQQDVKATFYVVGRSDESSIQSMKDIAAAGHTLGMHSYSHEYKKIYASVESYLEDMYQLFVLLRDKVGVTPTCFRFPGGSINSYNYSVYQDIMTEMLRRGFVPCDWNLSSGDATGEKISSGQIVRNVTNAAANVTRGFVLMHDAAGKESTVGALKEMIGKLRDMGFTFAAITSETKPVLFSYLE